LQLKASVNRTHAETIFDELESEMLRQKLIHAKKQFD
jgi:hypothetical protein